jgi:hypothetical protein
MKLYCSFSAIEEKTEKLWLITINGQDFLACKDHLPEGRNETPKEPVRA